MNDDRVWTGEMRREYGLKQLKRKDLVADPVAQFDIWFKDGIETLLEPNAVALATADASGHPSARMVLMKSYDHRGIVFATNYSSRKGKEIAENPNGTLLFYWPKLERQVRISGAMEKTDEKESDEIFNSRHPKSRIGAIASHQSHPIESREALESNYFAEEKKWQGDQIDRPSFWGGYRLVPVEFEFWQGGEHRLHDRFVYLRQTTGWDLVRLQP